MKPKQKVKIVREQKTKAGIYRIMKQPDGTYTWTVTSRNGYTTTANRKLKSVRACDKGALATTKCLAAVFK